MRKILGAVASATLAAGLLLGGAGVSQAADCVTAARGCDGSHHPGGSFQHYQSFYASDACDKCQRAAAGISGSHATFCRYISVTRAELYAYRR
ncbi:hypothetical protein [Amycolatopsis suaedae]|uniref:Uncharacterized protein n=1 Tax=Amycolatopsis suaedae TaxID=2510978 RepID=A0A4Q7J7S0_9PSEU|nr:hypothetical protein [Amycolatopsis suaedae]RZQ62403.1 hypothetical protein EWH70_19235 [Amycolatopsis suaedae]